MSTSDRHVFALYIANIENTSYTITDAATMHRVQHVLRLKEHDHVIVFNRTLHARATIISITKKAIGISLEVPQKNKVLVPSLHLCLPVLKKDALSDAVYNAVEAGATHIQLVHTDKAQRAVSDHEMDRLERVAIAAAEQSKYFAFPRIAEPISFEKMIEHASQSKAVFFDPTGKDAQLVIANLIHAKDALSLLIGPEGDLTVREKELLTKHQWEFCALTPTILRAVQAVTVGLGLMRSCLT